MAVCEACSTREGTHHITVSVTVFGPKTTRVKKVQFMLCENCVLALGQVMADDRQKRQRMAWRLTQDPQLFSVFRDRRERRFAGPARAGEEEGSRNKNSRSSQDHMRLPGQADERQETGFGTDGD